MQYAICEITYSSQNSYEFICEIHLEEVTVKKPERFFYITSKKEIKPCELYFYDSYLIKNLPTYHQVLLGTLHLGSGPGRRAVICVLESRVPGQRLLMGRRPMLLFVTGLRIAGTMSGSTCSASLI